jgi:carboxymethylenebutenolidase
MGKMTTIADIPVWEVIPAGESKGGLIVIHEVWGLSDHIKDVADRFGKEGYYVIAPDLLSETDIEKHLTPDLANDLFNPEKRNAAQPILRKIMAPIQEPEFGPKTTKKLRELFDYTYEKAESKQKVAVVGYCFGGSYSFNLAVEESRLSAVIPYYDYGHADQTAEELRLIECPVLAFYGEQDERLMEGLPDLEERMHEANVDFTAEVYGNCGHAFFNDTNQFAYNDKAAKNAWKHTLDFLDINLNSL